MPPSSQLSLHWVHLSQIFSSCCTNSHQTDRIRRYLNWQFSKTDKDWNVHVKSQKLMQFYKDCGCYNVLWTGTVAAQGDDHGAGFHHSIRRLLDAVLVFRDDIYFVWLWTYFEIIKYLSPLCILLGFTNSAINPVLYAFLSPNFRKLFVRAFRCAGGAAGRWGQLDRPTVSIASEWNSSRSGGTCEGACCGHWAAAAGSVMELINNMRTVMLRRLTSEVEINIHLRCRLTLTTMPCSSLNDCWICRLFDNSDKWTALQVSRLQMNSFNS